MLVSSDSGRLMIVKGSVDEVCRRCSFVEYKGKKMPMAADRFSSIHAVVDEMLEDGMKVLAVACKQMDRERLNTGDEYDLTLLGYLAFFDAPKKTAAGAVQKLKKQHIKIKVLTGDQRDVAVSVCRRLGIDAKHILTGSDMDKLTDDEQQIYIEKTTVFSELSPKQKVQIVQLLQMNGHTVGFLGDGMNDLPAMWNPMSVFL